MLPSFLSFITFILFFLPFVITEGDGKVNYHFVKNKCEFVSLGIACFFVLLSENIPNK
jgi:hypothetical protein